MPEVIRACDHDCIPQIDVVFVSVYVRYYPQESRKLRHDSEEAHRLRPSVPESALSSQNCLVAQPLVKDIAEEHHARVHVNPAFSIKNLMPHHIRHCCPTRKTGECLNFVQSLKQIVAEGEILTGYVGLAPYFEFKIRVKLHILLDNYAFGLRHLSSNPNLVDNFGYELRPIPFGIWLIVVGWVKDGKLSHSLPILHQMIHVVSHREGLNLKSIYF